MHRKINGLIICCSILINTTSLGMHPGRHNPHIPISDDSASLSTLVTVALAGSASALVGYGIYRLGQLVFHPSDQKVLEKTNTMYHEAYAHYHEIATKLKDSHSLGSNNHDIIYNFSEAILYQIAIEKHYEASIDPYLSQLNSSIKNLESYNKKLLQRSNKLYTTIKTDYENVWLYDHMKALQQKISTFLPSLYLLRDYLKHHRSYLKLFELESSLLYRYSQELNALSNYLYDHKGLKEAIHSSVMLHQHHTRAKYPYISYADTISKDMEELQNTLNRLAYNYAERIYYAQDLYNKLNSIKAVVVAATQYHTELIEWEKARRKEKELSIQQQQLNALQHQNHLYERDIQQHEQQQWIGNSDY